MRVGAIAEEVLRRAGERELLRTIQDATVFVETVSVAILSQDPLVEVGEPADAFLMEYVAIVSALVLTDDEARRAGEQMLVAALPDGMALLPGTTEASAGGDVSYDGSRLVADLTATGLATPLIDPRLAARRAHRRLAVDRGDAAARAARARRGAAESGCTRVGCRTGGCRSARAGSRSPS